MTMNCDEVNTLLNGYVDNELPAEQAQQVEAHIRGCAACNANYRELMRLGAVIASVSIRASAPPHLARCISAGLKENDRRYTSWSGGLGKLAYSVLALLLGLVIGWATLSPFHAGTGAVALPPLLASAHIRSLMVDHLTDIASSDSHTVKPWFHGRLDFSPPVEDLTRYGYPLLGGRLEYVAGDAVAALVYRHRQHVINLFISPGAAPAAGVQTEKYNGYNIVRWTDGSLSYAAVSDLKPADLERFRALLSDRGVTGNPG